MTLLPYKFIYRKTKCTNKFIITHFLFFIRLIYNENEFGDKNFIIALVCLEGSI